MSTLWSNDPHYPPNLIDGVSTPAELDALPVGSVVRRASGQVFARVHQTPDDADWQAVGDRSHWWAAGAMAEHEGPATLLHVPGRDLLAEAEARGVERARVDLAAQVAQAEATVAAEAEARGYERGKRDALTEAADELEQVASDRSYDSAEVVTEAYLDAALRLRARAAETPGGAA